jgi:hypothetical protein
MRVGVETIRFPTGGSLGGARGAFVLECDG